jgi:hypothetical protein
MGSVGRLRAWIEVRIGVRGLAGLVVVLGLWVFDAFTSNWVAGTALPYLGARLKELLSMPIGSFGLMLVILIAVLIVVAFIETSPAYALLKTWLERRRQPTGESASLRRIPDLEAEIKAWKQDAMDRQMWQDYGRRVTPLPPLSEMDRRVLALHLQELLPSLHRVVHSTERVQQDLWKKLPADNAFMQEWARYKYATVYRRMQGAAQRLYEEVNGGDDPRLMLLCFYERYRECRDVSVILGQHLGVLTALDGYTVWQEQDVAFWEEWNRKLSTHPLEAISAEVVAIENHDGPPRVLPKA